MSMPDVVRNERSAEHAVDDCGNSCDHLPPDVSDAIGSRKANEPHDPRVRARMPVERYASDYNMNHKRRGLALIFNHENFDVLQLKARAGTNVDCENLTTALKDLDFEVRVHKDLKLRELQREIERVAQMDHSDADCILVTILSHGELGYLYAKDCQYKLDVVWSYFTANHCPTLAGKPKLFFVQACQGDQLDGGVLMSAQERTETDGSGGVSYKLPTHADFLFAFSTIPGFYSWRNTQKGSWFMQSLCHELNQRGRKYDLMTLLTFVTQRVAYDFESNTPDIPLMHQQKQIPCTMSMLTRLLRFGEKKAF
uniref:Caspase n=1 Tax=Anopheles dirus TaxID=7168 RepID=A0A182N1J2_9DIPT